MSSIVNKSNVRFTPKIKQRRSTQSTPNASRGASVAPSIESSVQPKEKEQSSSDSSDSENNSDDEDKIDSINNATSTITEKPSIQPTRRRSSVADNLRPQETKQRRLSTLSNTSRAGDLFKKIPFEDNQVERPHVIGIPIAAPTAAARRRSSAAVRRSSIKKSVSKETTAVTVLPSPASTQEQVSTPSPSLPLPLPEVGIDPKSKPEDDQQQKTEKIVPNSPPQTQQDESATGSSSEQIQKPDGSAASASVSASEEEITNDLLALAGESPDSKSKLSKLKKSTGKHTTSGVSTNTGPIVFSSFSDIPRHYHNAPAEEVAEHKIDEDTFTMEELCRPSLPLGKASSNFEQARQARLAKIKQRAAKRQMREEAKMKKIPLESLEDPEEEQKIKKIKAESLLDQMEDEIPNNHNHAIQLKVGTDGQLIVDEESRFRDRHAGFDETKYTRHEENPFENVVNSATYGRQRYTDKWDDNELKRFYEGLSQWGTDFGMIAQMFPHRTRRQVKAKFISEEKRRPKAVELALARKLNFTFDLNKYSQHANRTYAEVTDFNEKLLKLKEEHDQNLKELSIAKEKAKEEDLERHKQREFEVKTGQRTLTRKERVNELRKHETVLGSLDDIKKQRESEAAAAAAAATAS